MDVALTCCCGTEVSTAAGTCPTCATSVRSLKRCARNDAPAVSAED